MKAEETAESNGCVGDDAQEREWGKGGDRRERRRERREDEEEGKRGKTYKGSEGGGRRKEDALKEEKKTEK